MDSASREAHWQNVYTTKGENEVSWFQENPAPSLELLTFVKATPKSVVIDIGGGASRLVDVLVSQGYDDVTVLDLSEAALATARMRLASKGEHVKWVAADVTAWEPAQLSDVWHDRAAFHFLTEPDEQRHYADRIQRGLRPGGHLIIGTFALDGPEKCSGLPVARHDAKSLAVVFGDAFVLLDTRRHEHATPWDASQRFQFSTFQFRP
ncbi:MAG: class I SAM-dependent methyltransferase [Pseudomonadota bacterium]